MDVVAGCEVLVAGIAGETYRQPEIIPSSERCYNSDGRMNKATELKGTQGEIIQKVGSVQQWHEEFLTRSSVQKGVVFSALTLARLTPCVIGRGRTGGAKQVIPEQIIFHRHP